MKVRFDRVKAFVLLAVLFIYVAPLVPEIEENLILSSVVFMGVLTLWSAARKAWFDAVLALWIGAFIGIGRLLFPDVSQNSFIIRSTAVLAFLGLHDVLLIGPFSRWSKWVRKMYVHRRHLGVATFLLAWFHASTVLRIYFDYDFEIAFGSSFVIFGEIALLVMGWLALTSWDKVQKYVKLKAWYVIHTAVLVLYGGLLAYAWPLSFDITTTEKVVMVLFGVFWVAMAPYALPRLTGNRVNGWKQLHLLVYVAYVALIFHSWNAYVSRMEGWVPVAYWILIAITVSAHLIGLVQKFIAWQKAARHSSEALERGGITYEKVAAVGSVESGKAIKVVVNGAPVALFNDNGNYFGVSAICPHQGGPLDKGEIVDGYVECPWHKWQFAASDGQGPPDFPDCVPYYNALVEGDSVYLSNQPTDRCQLKNGQYKKVG